MGHWTIKLGRQTAPLAKVQWCEYENQTLEAFVVPSCLHTKLDCPVARHNFSRLTAAHNGESGLLD